MATKDKVLVIGSNASTASGSLKSLLTKVTSINSKHGPFTCVLCLGDLFPASASASDDEDQDTKDLVGGRLAVPVPMYFMLGERELPKIVQDKVDRDGGEVAENLSYLGKQTTLTLSSGLKIAIFGGSFSLPTFTSSAPLPPTSPSFSSSSLSSFISSPSLSSSSSPVDILLTHVWPSQISRYSEKPLSETVDRQEVESYGIPALQGLVGKTRPKYMFSGEKNLFWEREPFVCPAQQQQQTREGEGSNNKQTATRFLSLGHFGNQNKQRWFYAFSIAPSSSSSTSGTAEAIPANVTPCPFDLSSSSSSSTSSGNGNRGTKRNLQDEGQSESYLFSGSANGNGGEGKRMRHGEPPNGYKCKICNVPGHFVQDCPEKVDAPPSARRANGGGGAAPGPPPETYVCRLCNVPGHWIQDCPLSGQQGGAGEQKRPRNNGMPKDIAPEDCWFCLSNPQVTKHLIASIGQETYLTLPKGQLIDTTDPQSALVPGGGHCLIIPIAHYPTLASVPKDLSSPIFAEIDAYKKALSSLYASHGASLLAFEVSRAGIGGKGGHAHIQICPIPNTISPSEAERIFSQEAEKEGYNLIEDPSQIERILEEGNYFRLDLPGGKRLVHRIRMGERFSLQFGRTTTALLLGNPGRSDWKACAKSDREEGEDAKRFKEAFAKYDPSG